MWLRLCPRSTWRWRTNTVSSEDDFDSWWAEFGPVVEGVATEGGRRYHQYGADADDFRQELSLWCWQHLRRLERKRNEIDGDDEFVRYLARVLRNEVSDYAVDIRAQAGEQDRQTAYWYAKNELAALLEATLDPEQWNEPPVSETRTRRDPATGGNWIATLADISRALDGLREKDRKVLRLSYGDGLLDREIARDLMVTDAAATKLRERALVKLHRALGGPRPDPMRPNSEHDPWRGRHAIDNATAIATVDGLTEGVL